MPQLDSNTLPAPQVGHTKALYKICIYLNVCSLCIYLNQTTKVNRTYEHSLEHASV